MTLTILFSIISCSAANSNSPNIKISTKSNTYRVGEPIIIQLQYKFEKTVLDKYTNEPSEKLHIDMRDIFLRVESEQDSGSTPLHPLGIKYLYLKDSNEHIYEGSCVIFYNLMDKRLMFNEAGEYTIIAFRSENYESNELVVQIEQTSDILEKAISFLSDANDFFFLTLGTHEHKEKRTERIAHLKKVVDECEGTLLANWCAARLGIEYFKGFHKKHPSFSKFKEKKEKESLKESLFDDACKYLENAYKLPDEFPIRQEVLEKLATTEYIKGNYDKAISIIDEAAQKYPHSKLGKNAQRYKQEILELKQKEQQKNNIIEEPNDPNNSKRKT